MKKTLEDSPGIYYFKRDDVFLYAGYTNRLQKRLKHFFRAKEDDPKLAWLKDDDEVQVIPCATGFEALVKYKTLLKEYSFLHQESYHPADSDVYLAFDLFLEPLIKVTDDTVEEKIYLGPFKSRFYLYDMLDVLSKYKIIPPCHRRDENEAFCQNCSCYCTRDIDGWQEIILKKLLNPNYLLERRLMRKKGKFMQELEFEKATKLQKEIDLISRFRETLSKIIAMKHLNGLELYAGAKVENGLLCLQGEKVFTDYRAEEYLAFGKREFPEVEILYKHLQKICPDVLEEALKTGVASFISVFTNLLILHRQKFIDS